MPDSRPSIRRWAISLIVGVLMTVIISWLAMFLPCREGQWYGPPTDSDIGLVARSDGTKTFQVSRGDNAWHGVVSYWWMQISGRSFMMTRDDVAARWTRLDDLPAHLRPHSIDDLNMQSWYHQTGWPMPAMTCGVHWKTQIRNADIIYSVTGGIQLPRDAEFHPRALPLRPLWPGFAVNAFVWVGAFWLAMRFASAWRRQRRRRSNRCPDCGYLRHGISDSTACPECGRTAA